MTGDSLESVVAVEPLSIEVGYALVSIVDEKQGGTLLARVRAIRRQIAAETGMVVPSVHVADNLQLGPRTYAILVKGVEVARGELFADRLLAINPGTASLPLEGTATREPAFGLPATWIAVEARDRASAAGYTVVDPTTALSTHLSETMRTFLPDLLTRQQTKEMVDRVAETSPKLVEELVPKVMAVGDVQRVLRQLLRERVPVRDLTTILESVADIAATTKDPDAMTEGVRTALGRAICRQYQTDRGRAAGDQPVARARGAAARRRSCGPTRGTCSRSSRPTRRDWRRGLRARSKAPWHSLCFVHAGTATAPLAAVRAGAAAHRRAVAQRGAAARQGLAGDSAGVTCISSVFAAQRSARPSPWRAPNSGPRPSCSRRGWWRPSGGAG